MVAKKDMFLSPIRVTAEQKQMAEFLAEDYGMRVGDLVRALLVYAMENRPVLTKMSVPAGKASALTAMQMN